MIGGQSLMMPNRVHDGEYQRYDSWQGYPQEREHLLQHILQTGIKDVVFLTGDVHTVMAGDVLTGMGAGRPPAVEFAAGSITSASVGESNFRMPGRQLIPGDDANPQTPPEIQAHYRGLNPWLERSTSTTTATGSRPRPSRRSTSCCTGCGRSSSATSGSCRRPASAGRSSAARRRSAEPRYRSAPRVMPGPRSDAISQNACLD